MIDLLLARVPRQKLRAGLVAAALVLAVAAGVDPSARAATTPPSPPAAGQAPAGGGRATFGIKPSHPTLKTPIDERARFDYTATPGAVQPDFVALTNDALTPLELSVYASDGFNTASDGFDLLPAKKKPIDVGSWITLQTNVVSLKPGASIVIPFTVRVPAKVTPGDHVGGIVASLRTYGVDKKGDRVAIDQRVGARVYLRIQGPLDPRPAITNLRAKYAGAWWNPFASGKVTVSYTVANRGNVRLGAHGAVDVGGSFGSSHSASVPDIAELLPDNVHQEQVVVDHVVRAFHEHATATLIPFSLPGDTDGRLTNVTATVRFWAVPWAAIAMALVLLLLALGLLRRLRSRPAADARTAGSSRESAEAK